jgi:hypothetical protein
MTPPNRTPVTTRLSDIFERVTVVVFSKTAAKVLGIALVLYVLFSYLSLIGVIPSRTSSGIAAPSPEEQKRNAIVAQQQGEASARARAEAQAREAERKAREKAAQEATRANFLATLRGMTPAKRLSEMVRVCSPGGECNQDRLTMLTDAAGSDAEKKALSAKSASLVTEYQRWEASEQKKAERQAAVDEQKLERQAAADEQKFQIQGRVEFAEQYETALLNQHMNPDGVSATGPGKTTLTVRGWFCNRQFLFDFQKGPLYRAARDEGFKQLQCISALEVGTLPL